jgi:cytochrome P450
LLTACKILLTIATKALYNMYLHPLARFPGPKLYAVSSIPVALAQLRGTFHRFTQTAHEKYGSVVRISPNELSFVSAAAWNDIYGRSQGKPPLPRDKTFFNEMLVDEKTLTMANDQTHSRLRRAMNPAFAPRALAEQEPILQKNVDLFLNQLQSRAERGLTTDLRLWYNYITFDLIGDLAFGESFGCLAASTHHEWVSFVLDHFYIATLLQVIHRFRPLNRLLAAVLPQSLVEKKERHHQMALERVRCRIQRGAGRPDFVDSLIKAKEDGIITSDELEQQASILILAGSETTAVALTSVTCLLLQHPASLAKLVKELHTHFQNENQIDVSSVNKLHYLQAVIQEALRLFPPITNGFPRQTIKGGAIVDGHLIPDGVRWIESTGGC